MWRWCSRSWANGGCARGWRRCSDRRLVAPALLRRYLADGPRDLTAAVACRTAAERLGQLFAALPGGLEAFLRVAARSATRSLRCWPRILRRWLARP